MRKTRIRVLLISIIMVLLVVIVLLVNVKTILLLKVPVNEPSKVLIKEKLSTKDILSLRKDEILGLDQKQVLADMEQELVLANYHFANQEAYSLISQAGAKNHRMIVAKANDYLAESYTVADLKRVINNQQDKAFFITLIDKGIYGQTEAKLVLDPSRNLAIANYENNIYQYVPANLVEIQDVPTLYDASLIDGENTAEALENYLIDKDTNAALGKMCQDLAKEFNDKCGGMVVTSAYRSYNEQKYLYDHLVAADKTNVSLVLPAGASEHQLGNSIDFALSYVKQEDYGNTAQYRWVNAHAADYGFIIRYPQDKESITKIRFEPWHLRYVGVATAQDIKTKGLCLEEYVKAIK